MEIKYKKYIGFLIIPLVVTFIIYDIYSYKKIYNTFYKSKINSKIVKINYNSTGGRTDNYITESKVIMVLSSRNDKTVLLYDSISKKANSWEFKVYRKNKLEKYEFIKNMKTPYNE